MTPREILAGALALSARAMERQLAWEGEGLDAVHRALRALVAFGARINPEFFGARKAVEFNNGWLRPPEAELIYWIELPDGQQVVPVTHADRKAEEGLPAVYRLGQRFYGAGNPLDPTAGELVFLYARRPEKPASVDAEIDPIFPDGYDDLLKHEVAVDLAVKDGRADDLAALVPQRDRWIGLYSAFLEHETIGERRRYQTAIQAFNASASIPARALLAGGGA